jgi:hypothetical protein
VVVQWLGDGVSVTGKLTGVTGLTDASCVSGKKHATAGIGSLAYIRPHAGLFEIAGVHVKLPTY